MLLLGLFIYFFGSVRSKVKHISSTFTHPGRSGRSPNEHAAGTVRDGEHTTSVAGIESSNLTDHHTAAARWPHDAADQHDGDGRRSDHAERGHLDVSAGYWNRGRHGTAGAWGRNAAKDSHAGLWLFDCLNSVFHVEMRREDTDVNCSLDAILVYIMLCS